MHFIAKPDPEILGGVAISRKFHPGRGRTWPTALAESALNPGRGDHGDHSALAAPWKSAKCTPASYFHSQTVVHAMAWRKAAASSETSGGRYVAPSGLAPKSTA